MAGLSTGLKKLLKISPCSVDAGKISVDSSKDSFEVMINPSGYNHSISIKSNKKEPLGKSATETKFDSAGPETVKFDIWIDGTGVVNLPIPGLGSPDVNTQLEALKDVVYTYDGEEHSPNKVQLLWGTWIFYGTLDSMSVEYSLFKPSGEPLRAKVGLSFTAYQTSEEEALEASRASPDLAHVVEVKAGDTLPLLCYRIYKDPAYYLDIARVNKLVNFRSLVPGTRLQFPPLR